MDQLLAILLVISCVVLAFHAGRRSGYFQGQAEGRMATEHKQKRAIHMHIHRRHRRRDLRYLRDALLFAKIPAEQLDAAIKF